jgi:Bacterial protein of unknown function (DUF916)
MRRRDGWRRAAAAGLVALLAGFPLVAAGAAQTGTSTGTGAAIGTGGAQPFGLNPAQSGDGHYLSYFNLTAGTGQQATATVILSNLGHKSERLRLSRSLGVTAANGGIAYTAASGPCSGPACWLAGVARTVTLAAGVREKIAFTVRVPAGAARRQYLAGITAELAARPKATKVGRPGKATAKAVIVEQVTVGVAVTVGNVSQMRTRLEIAGVSGQAIGTLPRLNVTLRDTGQTFSGGTGRASCTSAGKTHSYRVVTNTILPGDQARIAVNARSVPEGATVPCVVRIHYGHGQTVSWSGMVTVPKTNIARIVHTGPGTYSVIPTSGIPGWAIALIVVGGVVIAAVAVLLVRMRRVGRFG